MREKFKFLIHNKKFLLPVFMGVVLALGFFFVGILYSKYYLKKTSGTENTSNSVNLEQELESCLLDQPSSIVSASEEIYDFSKYKIYSPLFDGKEISKKEFEYKKALIVSRTIQIDENLKVVVWVLEKPSEYLSELPDYLNQKMNTLDLTYSNYPKYDFPIYNRPGEWGYLPGKDILLSSNMPEFPNTNDMLYTTAQGVKTYIHKGGWPILPLIDLHFYTVVDQGKTQLFVEIIKDLPLPKDWDDQRIINKSVTELKETVDTISLTK